MTDTKKVKKKHNIIVKSICSSLRSEFKIENKKLLRYYKRSWRVYKLNLKKIYNIINKYIILIIL